MMDNRRNHKFRSDQYDDSYYDDRGSGGGGGHRYDQKDESGYHHNNSYSSHRRRSRSRSRSPARSTNGTDYRSNRSRHDNYDRGNNYGQQQSGAGGRNNYEPQQQSQQPTRTILIRQLPLQINDDDLTSELASIGMSYKQVRLVKSRETGMNRGFAFVEFNSVDEAKYWIDSSRGYVDLPNFRNVRVQLCFSHSNEDPFKSNADQPMSTEWFCAKCGVKNFKKRDKCFKCGISREESERRLGGEAYDYCGQTPCNTLVLRGLDALTTNEVIIEALNRTSNAIQVKNCHIARDPFTNVSSGFAFVEFDSIQESNALLQIIQPFFELEGKQITSSYSKNNFQTAISQLESNTKASYEKLGSRTGGNADSRYQQSYQQQFNSKKQNSTNKQANETTSGAAVAQAAIQSMAKKQELITHLTSNLKKPPSETIQTPDPSQFTYDEKSGYYYDYSTGYFYDPNTQYYYNSLTQQYMYWDPLSSTYIPVTAAVSSDVTTEAEKTQNPSEETKDETLSATTITTATGKSTNKPVTKNAVQIAKEMEKWAQSMNKKKDVLIRKPGSAQTTVSTASNRVNESFSSVRPAFDSEVTNKPIELTSSPESSKKSSFVIESIDKHKNGGHKSPTLPNATLKIIATTVNANNLSTSPLSSTEASLIDESRLTCLLCKRKFDSLDILSKHVAKSDLHKKNLEVWRQRVDKTENQKRENSSDDETSYTSKK